MIGQLIITQNSFILIYFELCLFLIIERRKSLIFFLKTNCHLIIEKRDGKIDWKKSVTARGIDSSVGLKLHFNLGLKKKKNQRTEGMVIGNFQKER